MRQGGGRRQRREAERCCDHRCAASPYWLPGGVHLPCLPAWPAGEGSDADSDAVVAKKKKKKRKALQLDEEDYDLLEDAGVAVARPTKQLRRFKKAGQIGSQQPQGAGDAAAALRAELFGSEEEEEEAEAEGAGGGAARGGRREGSLEDDWEERGGGGARRPGAGQPASTKQRQAEDDFRGEDEDQVSCCVKQLVIDQLAVGARWCFLEQLLGAAAAQLFKPPRRNRVQCHMVLWCLADTQTLPSSNTAPHPLVQFDEDEDDWLVHDGEEEEGGAEARVARRRRRRAMMAGLGPGIDADALEEANEIFGDAR